MLSSLAAARATNDSLRKDNRLYLRIVNEKQAKILQLENALTTLQREVIVRALPTVWLVAVWLCLRLVDVLFVV